MIRSKMIVLRDGDDDHHDDDDSLMIVTVISDELKRKCDNKYFAIDLGDKRYHYC